MTRTFFLLFGQEIERVNHHFGWRLINNMVVLLLRFFESREVIFQKNENCHSKLIFKNVVSETFTKFLLEKLRGDE